MTIARGSQVLGKVDKNLPLFLNKMDRELKRVDQRQVSLNTWVYKDGPREVSSLGFRLQLPRSLKEGSRVKKQFLLGCWEGSDIR